MEEIKNLLRYIKQSPTQYHAVSTVREILDENGFVRISERDMWKIVKGGRYYVVRNGSSLIAFEAGENFYFNIVAAHTDSPAIKIKGNPAIESSGVFRLNAEVYGGPIYHTWLDRKLSIAGRAFYQNGTATETRNVCSDFNVVIPSVSIHQNRDVNEGAKINPQIDLLPITGATAPNFLKMIGEDALGCELYAVCAEDGYIWGENNEFVSAPRLDDLQGVFAALSGFIKAEEQGIKVLALFDSEEVGSMTRQGAYSTFLKETLERVTLSLGKSREEFFMALADSTLISLDNAHARHPAHPELYDPTNNVRIGGGIVIKNSAGCNYTTDGLISTTFKRFFNENNIRYQDFYNRSDMRSGSALGVLSLTQLSVASLDLGLPQFAMHSIMETVGVNDYAELINALKTFYSHFKV